MKIQPLNNLVLIRPIPEPTTTKGGLHIPDSARDLAKIRKAEVLAVGPGITLPSGETKPIPCKPGDVVLMSKVYDTVGEVVRSVGNTPTYCLVEASRIMAIVGEGVELEDDDPADVPLIQLSS